MAANRYPWDSNDTNTAPLPGTLQTDGYADGAIPEAAEFNEFWRDITLARDEDAAKIAALQLAIIPGVVRGLGTENNTTLPNTDLDFQPGIASDSTLASYLNLPTLITKKLNALWAEGTLQGGLATGAVAPSTTYHAFVIEKDSDGTIDALFDTSPVAANRPAGWTKFARVASILTDAGSNIIAYFQDGNRFVLDLAVNNTSGLGTSPIVRTALAMAVPTGIPVLAEYTVTLALPVEAPEIQYVGLFTSEEQTDTAPTANLHSISYIGNRGASVISDNSVQLVTKTNITAEIFRRFTVTVGASGLVSTEAVITKGWIDKREGDTY